MSMASLFTYWKYKPFLQSPSQYRHTLQKSNHLFGLIEFKMYVVFLNVPLFYFMIFPLYEKLFCENNEKVGVSHKSEAVIFAIKNKH